ncbi:MAG: sigma-70 family RNA polymerase sigma factor [Clostridiales bacterium]|nr:sigma-70 family RNA polymerase sigma factor [Clostridiales bacterium]
MKEFEAVFEENRDLVFRYLIKLCRSDSLAEELTQETFFRAYINFATIRSKERCSSWLCQTAKNCYFSWYNEHKKTIPLDEAGDETNDPFEDNEDKELCEKAYEELSKLEEPYKKVFTLNAVGGVSLKEISRMFGKSESWARVTYYRARQKLAERMKKYEL